MLITRRGGGYQIQNVLSGKLRQHFVSITITTKLKPTFRGGPYIEKKQRSHEIDRCGFATRALFEA
jgi:hypothetical protein